MGRVSPNHAPHPGLAVPQGTLFVTTRPVVASGEGDKPSLALPPQTRLRHVDTRYAAECIPAIEYADIYFSVETGGHAGEVVWFLTFEMNRPVEEIPVLQQLYGLEPVDEDGNRLDVRDIMAWPSVKALTHGSDAYRWPRLPLPPSQLIRS